MNITYLGWFLSNTAATWWHDSADPQELTTGLELKASGVTTNPVLCATALAQNMQRWDSTIRELRTRDVPRPEAAEALMGDVARLAAERLLPQYRGRDLCSGYVCAQVNPGLAAEREPMLATARRFYA
jgi:transaldolase